jgi:acyl-CoA thioester hydrolase
MIRLNYNYIVEPRFSETDAYGIMHHSSYYRWFEEARFNFSKQMLNFNSDLLNGFTLKFPVIESQCKYKRAVEYGEKLKIELIFELQEVAKVTFYYKARNLKTNKIHAEGKTIHTFLTKDNVTLLNIPQWFIEQIEAIQQWNE